MVVGRRAFAAASGLAVLGSLVTMAGEVAADEPPGNGVTFSAQSAVVPLLAHYSHLPTQGVRTSRSGADEASSFAALSPKRAHGTAASAAGKAGGARSDNTNSDNENGGQTVAASFIGQQSSETTCSYFGPGCNPPDMAIAASPQFVLQGVNTQWEVLDPAGNVQPGWPVSAQNFFGIPFQTNPDGSLCDTAHRSQPFVTDPRALYDPIDHRFWAAMIQISHVPELGVAADCPFKSLFWLSVSQTSNPNGRWNVYAFNTSLDGAFFNDFTQIGLNGQAVYASLNMFNFHGGLNGGFYAELFEANKAQMEKGKANFKADGFFDLLGHGPGAPVDNPFVADTVQPAMNLDSSAGQAETFIDTLDGPDPVNGHLCSSSADSCSGLALWTMTDPIAHDTGGPAPRLLGRYVPTKPFVFSPAADQPSCQRCIDADALDLRIPGTPMIRNGVIYGAWETAVDNSTQIVPGIEWAQVNLSKVGTEEASTTGYYNFSGDAAASYAALMPDSEGNVLMLFEHMSSTVFPETRFIVKSADENFHGSGTLLKAGEDNYRPQLCVTDNKPRPCRWGDFEAASWDGVGRIWFAGEYANTLNLGRPQNGRNWGTWIGAIDAS